MACDCTTRTYARTCVGAACQAVDIADATARCVYPRRDRASGRDASARLRSLLAYRAHRADPPLSRPSPFTGGYPAHRHRPHLRIRSTCIPNHVRRPRRNPQRPRTSARHAPIAPANGKWGDVMVLSGTAHTDSPEVADRDSDTFHPPNRRSRHARRLIAPLSTRVYCCQALQHTV